MRKMFDFCSKSIVYCRIIVLIIIIIIIIMNINVLLGEVAEKSLLRRIVFLFFEHCLTLC